MPRKTVEANRLLGSLTVRIPLDLLGDLFYRANDERIDPSIIVGRALSDYLRRSREGEKEES